MKKSLLFICVFLNSFLLLGQSEIELNKLLQNLKTTEVDSSRLKTLMQIVDLLGSTKSPQQLEYIDQAEKLAKALNNNRILIRVYNYRGNYYTHRGDFKKSLESFLESAKIIENIGDEKMLVSAYLGIGQAFSHLGQNHKKAKDYYDKAEALVMKIKDTKNYSTVFEQIAFYYYYENDFDLCLKYHFKALEFAKKYNSDGEIGNILNEIGLTYIQKKQYKIALENLEKARAIYQKLPNLPLTELAYVYSDMGLAYAKIGNSAMAMDSYQKSIKYAQKAETPETVMENYAYLAELYEQQKDYKNQATFLKKYYSIKDSLFNSDSKNKITELEADFQIEKKNTELARKEIEINESNYQRKIWGGLAIFLLILIGVLGYFYRKIQTKSQQISQQKEELQQLNHVKDRLFAVLSHDLRNPLATLKAYFSMLSLPTLSAEKREKYTQQTLQAVNSTSDLMDNLLLWANSQLKSREVNLTNISLQETIENVVDLVKPQAEQKNIEVVQKLEVVTAISNQNILETILRNLVTNAIKFSPNDSKVVVSTYVKNTETFLSVHDSGIGINQEKIQSILKNEISKSIGTSGEKGSSIGLLLVRELVQQINAELIIESEEGVGSTFIIKF